jgi:transcriptional regulator with XRE-family HTH domain
MTPDQLETLKLRIRAHRDLPPPAVCRLLRESAHLSQEDIATAVGVSRQAIYNYEHGRRRPRGDRLTAYVAVIRALRE